jgi:phage replication O-like protein O
MGVKRPRYTQISNDLIDNLMPDMHEAELKVMLFIFRKTLGFHQDDTTISLRAMAAAIKMSSGSVSNACQSLIAKGLISKTKSLDESGDQAANVYAISFEDSKVGGAQPGEHLLDGGARPDEHGVLNQESVLRNKETVSKETVFKTPLPLLEKTEEQNLYPEDDVITFAENLLSRNRRPRQKLKSKPKVSLAWKISSQEARFGVALYRSGMINFVESSDAWLREHDWTLNRFVQSPERWFTEQSPVIDIPIIRRSANATQESVPDELATPPRDYPDEWNRIVTAKPVEWDLDRSPVGLLNTCVADPKFSERFEEICTLAQKIHVARGDEVKWLTFGWIIKRKAGEAYNWWKLLTDLDGMATPDSRGKKPAKSDPMAEAFAAVQKRIDDAQLLEDSIA